MATEAKTPVRRATAKAPAKKTRTAAPVKKARTGAAPAKKAPVARKGFPARKPGTVARKRKPLPQFKAPADFKPHFLLVTVKTEADGLFGAQLDAVRYQGRFDRAADERKKATMSEYDSATLIALAARLGGVTYKATNDKKYDANPKAREGVKGAHRLPAKTTFQILMRVGRRTADNTLTVTVKQIWQGVVIVKAGAKKAKLVELLKTDPAYRMIRKSSRFLPAAFANVQMPPKPTRRRRGEEEDDE